MLFEIIGLSDARSAKTRRAAKAVLCSKSIVYDNGFVIVLLNAM
jgi:hypothetical protein